MFLFVTLAVVASLLLAAFVSEKTAWAQCRETGARDALQSARGSRFLLLDYDELQVNLDRDLGAHAEADTQFSIAPPAGHVFASLGGDARSLGGYDVCTDRGQAPGQLEQLRGGLTAGYAARSGWGIRVSWVVGQDKIEYGERRGRYAVPGAWSFTQQLWAVELRPAPQLAITFSRLGGEYESLTATPEGEQLVPADGPPAVGGVSFLSARSAWLGGGASALWTSRGLDAIFLAFEEVPIAGGLSSTLGVGVLVEERQPTTRLGLRWSHGRTLAQNRLGAPLGPGQVPGRIATGWAISGEVGEEYRPVGLRDARLRLDGSLQLRAVARGISLVIDWGAYLEATMVGSRFFRETTGRPRTPGLGGGIQGLQGFRFGSVVFDVYLGVNRPETLALVPQAVSRLEVRGQMLWRFGW